ncbi:GFA family protein [Mesorhizobium caraganae]|uniref:GFA family protein n=1 Tax=Mesorhizobium caraganae TaxID=483206 RepID=UPI003339F7AF
MAEIVGNCLCGAVRFRLTGPRLVHYCHCTMCQKSTGAPAAVLAWVVRQSLLWTGEAKPLEYRSSPIAVRSFCGKCGSAIALAYDAGDEIGIHTAALDQRAELAPAPQYHYGAESQLPHNGGKLVGRQ